MYFQSIEEWAAFGAVADALVAHLADQGFVTSPSDLEDLYRDWRLVRGHPPEWYLRRADAREVLADDRPPDQPTVRRDCGSRIVAEVPVSQRGEEN